MKRYLRRVLIFDGPNISHSSLCSFLSSSVLGVSIGVETLSYGACLRRLFSSAVSQ